METKLTLRRMAVVAVFSLFATLSQVSQAQESGKLQRYGVKIGAQVSSIPTGESYKELPGFSIRPMLGFQVGGFMTFSLPDKLSLHTELFYSAQGFSEQITLNQVGGEKETDTHKYSVHYVKVPLLLQYAITEKLSAEVGPQFGVFLSSNIDEVDWDIFKRFDVAGALGLEYLLTDKLSGQLRYAHSFASSDSNMLWFPEKPRVFSLGVAYAF